MNDDNERAIVIAVTSPDQLFNAPPINPFSERDVDVLGESGLTLIVRQLQMHRRDWRYERLSVRLPPASITPGLERQLAEALRRYCKAKIATNLVEMHLMRVRSGVWLGILSAFVIAIIAAAYILFTVVFTGVPQAVQLLVAGLISLFSWVTLWDVLEALIFNPIPMQHENSALRKIIDLTMEMKPDVTTVEAVDSKRPA